MLETRDTKINKRVKYDPNSRSSQSNKTSPRTPQWQVSYEDCYITVQAVKCQKTQKGKDTLN